MIDGLVALYVIHCAGPMIDWVLSEERENLPVRWSKRFLLPPTLANDQSFS